MNQKIYFAGFLALFMCAVSFAAFATPSELDTEFGLGGVTVHPLLEGAFVEDAIVQPEGKVTILVDNGFDNELLLLQNSFEISRLDAYGNLDSNFGSNGSIYSLAQWYNKMIPKALALQSDGGIVVCGTAVQTYFMQGKNKVGFDVGVHRYYGNGKLDPTFGLGGKSIAVDVSGYGYYDSPADCAIQNDGSILVAGVAFTASDTDFSLVRYTSKGVLDLSFGKKGIVTTDFSGQEQAVDDARSIVIQPDGKIILVGTTIQAGKIGIALAKYNKGGSLDLSFGDQGKTVTLVAPFDSGGKNAFIQPDGKIVVTGKVDSPEGFNGIIVRYESDGKVDYAFGDEGVVIIESNSDSPWEINQFAFQPDGKILVSRVQNLSNGGGEVFSLIRYNPDGTLDQTFGENGEVHHNLGFSFIEPVKILPLDDNKILTVWQAQTQKNEKSIVVLKYLTKAEDESEEASLDLPDNSETAAPSPSSGSDNNSGEQDNNDFPEKDSDGTTQDQAGSSQGGCSLHRHANFLASPVILLLVTLAIYLSLRKRILKYVQHN